MALKKGSVRTPPRFSANDRVVYPGHGVAQITRSIEKVVGREVVIFFELKLMSKDMTVLVPAANFDVVGIRALCSHTYVTHIFKLLKKPLDFSLQEITAGNWSKRHKEYQGKMRTGDLQELCEMYRDLKQLATQKDLSFGEKNLLHQTELMLSEEIALVLNMQQNETILLLRSFFSAYVPQVQATQRHFEV